MKNLLIIFAITINLFAIQDCKKITILSSEWVDIETKWDGIVTTNKWNMQLLKYSKIFYVRFPNNSKYLNKCLVNAQQFKILKEWQTR